METVVGLAVGRGTGTELAAVFERVLGALTRRHGAAAVRVVRSERVYHSYLSLRAEGGIERTARLTEEDAAHYERFCRAQARLGTAAVFRTAINAQSLYVVRKRLQAVKVDALTARDGRLLLVRDQAQGFYTGDNHHTPGRVVRTMEFSRETTEQIVGYAVRRAREQWPGQGPARIVMAYKFHLLDGALDAWTAGLSERHGVGIRLVQPDTVNRNLIAHGLGDRTVVVAGNEWADIMHVVLLDRFGSERQEDRCTENVHLHPDLAYLTEYQTVHGSADDLEGTGRVNPVATVRAAALVAERHAGCAGAVDAVEKALLAVRERGVLTPDLGGTATTDEVVAALLDAVGGTGPGAPSGGLATVPAESTDAGARAGAEAVGAGPRAATGSPAGGS
ncbi:isocitrate/isopropylmalate family dehydrogenase [Streptomyces sp. NPDC005805]|uniref:isocitrate/isopropylmalate family dehydrogenase n=1 Tax=Streptomyces sp. NPDC005805 TaxID=3157068 RepID=UPI0033E8EFC4